jgi:hypothetical protein
VTYPLCKTQTWARVEWVTPTGRKSAPPRGAIWKRALAAWLTPATPALPLLFRRAAFHRCLLRDHILRCAILSLQASYPSLCFAILTGVLSFVVLVLLCTGFVVLSYPILRCLSYPIRRRILRCACSAPHRICCALLSLQASYPSLCHPSLCHPIITGLIAPTLFRCHRLHVVVASATSTRARPIVRTAWVWTTLWTREIGTCP